jgi:hypothetical protein
MAQPNQSSTASKSSNLISAKTGESFSMRQRPAPCHVLEIEDVHFNERSAVFIPQGRLVDIEKSNADESLDFANGDFKQSIKKYHPDLHDLWYGSKLETSTIAQSETLIEFFDLSILLSVYEVLKNNKDFKLIIVGHSESGEAESERQKLSEDRAKSVYFLLKGDGDEWCKIIEKRARIMDVQAILIYFNTRLGWNCNPGPIDDILGNLTRQAIKHFKKIYNKKFGNSILENGEINSQTWKAIFDVYMKELANFAGGEGNLKQYRNNLRFLDDSRPTLAYGDKYPLADITWEGYKSKKDRRVDIFFFKAGKEPAISDIEKSIYSKNTYRFEKTELAKIEESNAKVEKNWNDIEIEDIDDEFEVNDDLTSADYESECNMDDEVISDEDEWDRLIASDKAPPDISDSDLYDIPNFEE